MIFLDNCFVNCVAVIGVLVYLFYKYLTYHYNYWRDKGIPFKNPELFFGSWKGVILGKRSLGKIYRDIYNEYPNEKFVGTFKSRLPELTIRDPEMIKCVLVKDFQYFTYRSETISDKVEKLNANLLNVNGNKWKATRKNLTPVFTSGKLKLMFPLIVEKAEEFQKFLIDEVNKSDEQEVKELMARFTTDVIGSIAFGIQTNSISDSDAPFRKMGRQIFESSPIDFVKILFRLSAPKLFDFLQLRVIDKNTEDFFLYLVKGIIKYRTETNIKRNDFIGLMLELREAGYIKVNKNDGEDEQIEFTDVFMTAQAFIFFAAGFETSSSVMSSTLFELAKNPDVQNKLIAEIDQVLNKYEGKLSYEAISEMEYLDCVVNETMRKYPAASNLPRICTAKYTFPGTKLTIDEDTHIAIPVFAMHYDPQYYPDPHKYIPERFTAEEKQKRHPMVFLPFGEGPRNCIGLRFGKMQSMIGLASVLTKFTVHETSRTEERLTINPSSFITMALNGIWLKLKQR